MWNVVMLLYPKTVANKSRSSGETDAQQVQRSCLAWCRSYDLADANSAVFVDPAQGHSIAHGKSDDECIRPVMQERDVERRTASSILEGTFAECAVAIDAVDYYAVGIWRI